MDYTRKLEVALKISVDICDTMIQFEHAAPDLLSAE